MTQHPAHLHAQAAIWSLLAAWPLLIQAVYNESKSDRADLGTIQAWRPGSGRLSGQRGDPVLDAIMRHAGPGHDLYGERVVRSAQTIVWIAAKVMPAALPARAVHAVHGNPASVLQLLHDLADALPRLRPAAAIELAMWVGQEDRAVRGRLGEAEDHLPMPTLRCPRCDRRTLAIRGSAPRLLDRLVVCTPSCMDQDVPSIWTQEQLAAALDSKEKA